MNWRAFLGLTFNTFTAVVVSSLLLAYPGPLGAALATPAPRPLTITAAQGPETGETTQIRLLAHGEDSLAARLAAIRSATKSIDLMTYIFEPCDVSGKVLLEALVHRARKGVKVRLIVDQYEMSTISGRAEDLAAYVEKVNLSLKVPMEFMLYVHPSYGLLLNPFAINNRSHMKLLLVDAQTSHATYVVGGRNSSDAYFGLSSTMNYFDQDLMISGPSARKVRAGIERVLAQATFVSPSGARGGDFEARCLKRNARDQAVRQALKGKVHDFANGGGKVYSCSKIYVNLDDPRYRISYLGEMVGEDDLAPARLAYKHSTALVLNFIEGAHSSLNIVNQYYIPVAKLKASLQGARARGVHVNILTNVTGDAGPGDGLRMSGLIADAIHRDSAQNMRILGLSSLGSLNDRGDSSLVGAKWRIHTKTAVRDHKDILVSSFNFDARSYQINAEDAVMVANCPELAADLETEYEQMAGIYAADKTCSGCRAEAKLIRGLFPLSPPAGMGLADPFL